MMGQKLNLGCGKYPMDGWVNIDLYAAPGVNLVMDVEKDLPLPFADNSIEYVLASHVLEHLNAYEPLIVDIHRMLKPDGVLEIRVPVGFRPFAYHRNYFTKSTFDPFICDGKHDEARRENLAWLDPKADYELISRKHGFRSFPFAWHLKHYLNLNMSKDCMFGRSQEMIWLLRKPGKCL